MNKCTKCKQYGLHFNRNHKPEEFLEGDPTSRIWIIGINPANKQNWVDNRNVKELSNHFMNPDSFVSYFNAFKNVSPMLFNMIGKTEGVAHTDLVKCSSKKWPPDSCKGKPAERAVITNCKGYLIEQIKTYKPKIIICNGAPISKEIKLILIPIDDKETYYISKIENQTIYVVLSGFIGRIDNFSRRRLGVDIENLISRVLD